MPHLSGLNFDGASLQVAGRIQNRIATNIANADTPGFKARGIDFNRALDARLAGDAPAHAEYERGLPMGLDGNNVSLDHESVLSATNAERMREAMTFLKGDTQTLLTALRPNGGNTKGG